MIDFGAGVYLKEIDKDWARKLHEWRNDPKIWRWTRQNDLLTNAMQEEWVGRLGNDPSIAMYLIIPAEERSPIGVCGLTSIDHKNKHAEFSVYIAPKEQGRGLGVLAIKTLFYHGFMNMGLRSIWGEAFEDNPARKKFKEVGIHETGTRPGHYFKDGKYWDAIMLHISSEDFLKKHGNKSCF